MVFASEPVGGRSRATELPCLGLFRLLFMGVTKRHTLSTRQNHTTTFEALKACLISAPILGFPTEDGRFLLDTDASLYAVGGVLNQIQGDREVVIAYVSRSRRLSQRRYGTTCREMLAAVVMCTHFRSYLRGARFTLRTNHSSLRWVQKFRNGDGMLARWYMLLGQFSVTFEYRPGAQHANAEVFLDSVDNVRGLTVWYPRPIRGLLMWTPRRSCWISRSPRQKWATPWTWICCRSCCRSCLGLGWRPRCWRNLQICIKSGPYCGMFGTVCGAAVLAVADRELVSGHGREIVVPLGSSVRGLSTRGIWSGYDSSIS